MSSLRDVLYLTLRQQIALVKNKSISSFELCKAYLDKIHTINKQYNCFISIDDKSVLKQARFIDRKIVNNNLTKLPLLGIPISIKDTIHTKDIPTTFGSIIYKNFIPKEDAVSVYRIKKKGGIILGKTNTHQNLLSELFVKTKY